MSKEKKEIENGISFGGVKKDSTFWASIILLIIMVASIGGFALSSGGGNLGGDSTLPSEVPFQQFQDPNTGTIFWGAIKNNEQFIFQNITGYENRTDLANLAGKIRNNQILDIYIAPDFNSAETEYAFDKIVIGLNLNSTRIQNLTNCDANTIVLTLNNTFEGDCMVFNPNKGEEYKDAEILTYYLVQ